MENNKIPLFFSIGGDTRIRTGDQSFADSCLSHLAMSPYLSCRKIFVNKYYAIVYENITKTFGAGNGAQTRDLCLGKAALYQLSYSRTKLRAKL